MIVFDFDGVLVDSLREVAITSYNSLTGNLVTSHDELPEGFLERFLQYRHLVQPAADFPVFASWCILKQTSPLTPQGLTRLVSEFPEATATRRDKFFAARKRFIEHDRATWLALHSPYKPLWGFLQKSGVTPTIVTNKNREAVLELFQFFNLPLQAKNLFSAEKGATKHSNFEQLLAREKPEQVTFIDDSILNLLELKSSLPSNPPFTFLLANWGYLGPESVLLAEQNGITPINQQHLIDKFLK